MHRRAVRTRLAAAICLAIGFPALAQQPVAQAQSTEDKVSELDKVVVTGSRLMRETSSTPSPVIAIGREAIEGAATTELSELLLDVPGVATSSNTSNTQTSIPNAGISSIDLRGLGSNRTLVLIDGKRTVSNSSNSNTVSLSSIPNNMIERIEIVTGGSSAVYGSDAVAGVVNVVTRKDYDGANLNYRAGVTADGGGRTSTFDASFGKRFGDSADGFMLSLSREEDEGLYARERDWALRSVEYDDGDNALIGPDLSTSIPGGRFRAGAYWYDLDGTLREDFETAENGFDTRTDQTLIIPRDRTNVGANLDVALNDNVTLTAQLLYSRVDTVSQRNASPIINTTEFEVIDPDTGAFETVQLGRIDNDNPFVPAEIADGAPSSGIQFSRSLEEVGLRTTENRRDTWRGSVGLAGDINDNWTWAAHYSVGRYKQEQARTNALNLQRVQWALDAEVDPDNPGVVRCRSAQARADGCVPLNLFGPGSITPEMADYIRANLLFTPEIRHDSALAQVTGDLWEMPAGAVSSVFGMEYRREFQKLRVDPVTASGNASLGAIPEYQGSFNVKEAFAEFGIPLLADVAGAKALNFEAALRYAQYSQKNVSGVFSYRGGLLWEPMEGLQLRAQYARATRAPDLTELYSPPREDFDDVNDVCDGVTATTTGALADNCRRDPGIAAAIAENGEFTQEDDSVLSPNSGNLELFEETADTFTLGMAYVPRWNEDLLLSVDYYDIKVSDAIDSLSNNDLLRQCYLPEGGDPFFCGEITRNSQTGQITRILNRQLNLNSLNSRGVDVHASYDWDLAGAGLDGKFKADLRYSRVLELEQNFDAIDGTVTNRLVGEVGVPEHSAVLSLSYSNDAFRVGWVTRYIGQVVDSNDRLQDFREARDEDPTVETPLYLYLGSNVRHDLSASYKLRSTGWRFYAGIRNVFDKLGPFLPTGTDSGDVNNFNSNYDVRGRSYYAGVEYEF